MAHRNVEFFKAQKIVEQHKIPDSFRGVFGQVGV
jgi:hypothetical protein